MASSTGMFAKMLMKGITGSPHQLSPSDPNTGSELVSGYLYTVLSKVGGTRQLTTFCIQNVFSCLGRCEDHSCYYCRCIIFPIMDQDVHLLALLGLNGLQIP